MKLNTRTTSYFFYLLIIITIFHSNSCRTAKTINNPNSLFKSITKDTIYLRSGTFNITKPIVLKSGFVYKGNKTRITFSKSTQFPVIHLKNANKITLIDIVFMGEDLQDNFSNADYGKFNYSNIILIENSSNIHIKKCQFKNSYGSMVKALDVKKLRFFDCEFNGLGIPTLKNQTYSYDAIFLGGQQLSKDIEINKCKFSNIGTLYPPGYPPWPNDGDGVHIQSAGDIRNVQITNSTFNKCAARGVKIQSGTNLSIRKNKFIDCRMGVALAMAKPVKNVEITRNLFIENLMALGTDGAQGVSTVSDLSITNNEVDKCEHFLRTSGKSLITNAQINNNKIGQIETFFINGRLIDSEIKGNVIKEYATQKHKSYNMAMYLAPECENLVVENNQFSKNDNANREIINKSNKNVQLKNNKFTPKK